MMLCPRDLCSTMGHQRCHARCQKLLLWQQQPAGGAPPIPSSCSFQPAVAPRGFAASEPGPAMHAWGSQQQGRKMFACAYLQCKQSSSVRAHAMHFTKIILTLVHVVAVVGHIEAATVLRSPRAECVLCLDIADTAALCLESKDAEPLWWQSDAAPLPTVLVTCDEGPLSRPDGDATSRCCSCSLSACVVQNRSWT